VFSDPAGLGQNAVINSFLALVSFQLERATLAERLVEIDVFLFAQRFDVELKQVSEYFGALDIDEHQHVFAKGRLEFGHTFGLAELSGHTRSLSREINTSRVSARFCTV
jgi:hypothetical protein